MKKLVSVLLILVLTVVFASCGGKDNGETTTEVSAVQQTEEANTKIDKFANNKGGKEDSDDLLMTLYMDCNSEDYQELTGKIEHIETGIYPETSGGYFRFVSPKNGVKVRLEEIVWSPLTSSFETRGTVFEITAEKDKIYEFESYVAEIIPDFRLVAEYGELRAEYQMVINGYEVVTKLQMIAESNTPDEITEDSAFYQLCVARAVSDVYYNDRLTRYFPEVVWNTFAYAVTLNDAMMNGEDMYKSIAVSDWEADAYINAMYPSFEGKHPDLLEESYVEGSMGQYDRYTVTPWTFERFSTNEFYGVDDNGDGTYSVKIRIDDYRYEEGYKDFGLAVIVKPDASNPFGYVITDVIDCELPVG